MRGNSIKKNKPFHLNMIKKIPQNGPRYSYYYDIKGADLSSTHTQHDIHMFNMD